MAERQITDMPTRDAPNSRVTKSAERFALLAVNANFDGTAASGDFVPTVVVISDSGAVVGRFPANETVPAGDEAEVTFAPFLSRNQKRDRFGNGGTAAYSANGQTVFAGSGSDTAWVLSAGDALLDVTTNPRLPKVIYPGVYAVVASSGPTAPVAGKQGLVTVDFNRAGAAVDGFASQNFPLDGVPTALDAPGATCTVVEYMAVGDSMDCLLAHNNGANLVFNTYITVQRIALV